MPSDDETGNQQAPSAHAKAASKAFSAHKQDAGRRQRDYKASQTMPEQDISLVSAHLHQPRSRGGGRNSAPATQDQRSPLSTALMLIFSPTPPQSQKAGEQKETDGQVDQRRMLTSQETRAVRRATGRINQEENQAERHQGGHGIPESGALGHQVRISFTTRPPTSVRRKSRPWNGNVRFS